MIPVATKIWAPLGAVAALSAMVASPAFAQKADFSGQRIEVTVPFAAGGGTDVYVRALAPHLERHLPGRPTVIVRNVPGGGSITGANQFQARAKPDGLNVIAVSASTVASYVFDKAKSNFELMKWEPIVFSPQGSVVYTSPSTGVTSTKDIAKLKGQKLVFGGGTATAGEARHVVSLDLLGLNVNYVWGINRGPVRLAFERGEFNINYDAAPGYLKNTTPLVKAGKVAPLFTMGIFDSKGDVIRDPNFPDIPSFPEAYQLMYGKPPSGPGFAAWRALAQQGVMVNKALMLPAGTPKHIVEAWRTAIRNVFKDPEFEKTAAAVIEGYPQFIGEDARPILKEATTMAPEVWEWLRNYYKTRHNVTL